MSELSEENGEQGSEDRTMEQRIEALESAVNTVVQLYAVTMQSYHALMNEFREHRVSIEYLLTDRQEVIH